MKIFGHTLYSSQDLLLPPSPHLFSNQFKGNLEHYLGKSDGGTNPPVAMPPNWGLGCSKQGVGKIL